MPETIILPTTAGHSITARLFAVDTSIADSKTAKGICILAPATGVAQYLYDDFAEWLAEQGFYALTFDYDGMGLSVDGHVKQCRSDKLSWGEHDCPAVLNYVAAEFPQLERIWIGHSVGAHMLGMMPSTELIDRAITVGAGTGTWWYNSPPTRRMAWFLWYALVPSVVPFVGYWPGNRLGIMCDMPKGVIMQWRRWCLRNDYCVGAEGEWLKQRFSAVKLPIKSLAFSDDEMMSLNNVTRLHAFFTGADISRTVISPADIGQKRIGHIGWHKGKYRALWENYFLPELLKSA